MTASPIESSGFTIVGGVVAAVSAPPPQADIRMGKKRMGKKIAQENRAPRELCRRAFAYIVSTQADYSTQIIARANSEFLRNQKETKYRCRIATVCF